MMKISKLIKESLSLYQVKTLIKLDKRVDRAEIFNNIRGIPNVVIVKPEDDELLNSKETSLIGYSYVYIKFISNTTPIADMKKIHSQALRGDNDFRKIDGLLSFNYKPSKIEKI